MKKTEKAILDLAYKHFRECEKWSLEDGKSDRVKKMAKRLGLGVDKLCFSEMKRAFDRCATLIELSKLDSGLSEEVTGELHNVGLELAEIKRVDEKTRRLEAKKSEEEEKENLATKMFSLYANPSVEDFGNFQKFADRFSLSSTKASRVLMRSKLMHKTIKNFFDLYDYMDEKSESGVEGKKIAESYFEIVSQKNKGGKHRLLTQRPNIIKMIDFVSDKRRAEKERTLEERELMFLNYIDNGKNYTSEYVVGYGYQVEGINGSLDDEGRKTNRHLGAMLYFLAEIYLVVVCGREREFHVFESISHFHEESNSWLILRGQSTKKDEPYLHLKRLVYKHKEDFDRGHFYFQSYDIVKKMFDSICDEARVGKKRLAKYIASESGFLFHGEEDVYRSSDGPWLWKKHAGVIDNFIVNS